MLLTDNPKATRAAYADTRERRRRGVEGCSADLLQAYNSPRLAPLAKPAKRPIERVSSCSTRPFYADQLGELPHRSLPWRDSHSVGRSRAAEVSVHVVVILVVRFRATRIDSGAQHWHDTLNKEAHPLLLVGHEASIEWLPWLDHRQTAGAQAVITRCIGRATDLKPKIEELRRSGIASYQGPRKRSQPRASQRHAVAQRGPLCRLAGCSPVSFTEAPCPTTPAVQGRQPSHLQEESLSGRAPATSTVITLFTLCPISLVL